MCFSKVKVPLAKCLEERQQSETLCGCGPLCWLPLLGVSSSKEPDVSGVFKTSLRSPRGSR